MDEMDEIYKLFKNDQVKIKTKVSIFYPYKEHIIYLLSKKESRLSIYNWLVKKFNVGSSYENFNKYCKRNIIGIRNETPKNNIRGEVNVEIENTEQVIDNNKPIDQFYETKGAEMQRKIQELIEKEEQ